MKAKSGTWGGFNEGHEIGHPVASSFGGKTDMQLVHMSQKASTSVPALRKERAPNDNPLVGLPIPATDRTGEENIRSRMRSGSAPALVLMFRPRSTTLLECDLNQWARIRVFRSQRTKLWVASLMLRRPKRVLPEREIITETPAHIEAVYARVGDVLERRERFVPKKIRKQVLPARTIEESWEEAISSHPFGHPARAVRDLAKREAWLYFEGTRRSLEWRYRSIVMIGLGAKQENKPKSNYVSIVSPFEGGAWAWEFVPSHHIPEATLPDNTGMSRTPVMPDIRNEMSLYANGDYDPNGTIDGKPRNLKKRKSKKRS